MILWIGLLNYGFNVLRGFFVHLKIFCLNIRVTPYKVKIMRKTIKFYRSKDKRVKPMTRIDHPLYQTSSARSLKRGKQK